MTKKLTTIDLFAGCGGLTEGFEQTGKYKLDAVVEWDSSCCETLKKRLRDKWGVKNSDEVVYHYDIQETESLLSGWKDDEKYASHSGLGKIKNIDIIVGGPPCQAYSLAGRIRDKNGMQDDYRNYLFESYAKIVEHYKPKAFVFENVLGILSAKPGGISIIDRIRETFDSIGYYIYDNLRDAVFDVADYGVPQHRNRIIIFGVNKNEFKNYKDIVTDFYNLMRSNKCKTKMTVQEAIGDLPKIFPDKDGNYSLQEDTNISWHKPRKHSLRDQKIFNLLAKDIETGENKFTNTEKLKELYFETTGKQSNVHKYYVLRKNEPSNTIPAHLHKDGLRHIHPDSKQARTITVREAARLQTFPDDFDFCGSQSDAYKMIGNAVPPNFAKIVAECVSKVIGSKK